MQDSSENRILEAYLDDPEGDVESALARFERDHLRLMLGDRGQRQKAISGNALQRLVRIIVEDEITRLNQIHQWQLSCTSDRELKTQNLDGQLAAVREQIMIRYSDERQHLPDADVVVYRQQNAGVVCILSCKTSLRDRLKQTAYWKLKLLQGSRSNHVRVALITPDKDADFVKPSKRLRLNDAIVHHDLDAIYVLRKQVHEVGNVKRFSSFEHDLRSWGGGGGG